MKSLDMKQYLAQQLNNKTVLITGSTGMVGQSVVRLLLLLNHEYRAEISILAQVRNVEKAKLLYSKELMNDEIRLVISDIKEIEIDEKIDYIIHGAGVTGGSKQHVDFPMNTIATALEGTKRILDIAKDNSCKGIVFLSSLEVYGQTGVDRQYIFENDGGYIDPMNPRSSYSESKRMCECMFTSYAKQYAVPAKVARLTASFGKGVASSDNRVFSQFAKSIISGKDIILRSTGETVRNYCDVSDVADALMLIAVDGIPGEAYNVANMETEISIKDLALSFIRLYPESGTKLVFDLSEDVAKFGYNGTMRNVLNSSKLMELGWKPKYGLDEMIRHLIESLCV